MNSRPSSNATLSSSLTGFGIAFALTAIPFAMAATRLTTRSTLLAIIALTGIAQAFVHLRYFLHLSFETSARGKLTILIFSLLLIAIMGGGTILVMSDLNARIM